MRIAGRYRAFVPATIGFALMLTAGCASKPPAAPPPVAVAPPAPVIPAERKTAWILRLEHQRALTDPAVGADLLSLAMDPDSGIRRRAVVAIGRVGMAEGVPVLVTALTDTEEPIRAAAAFGLGLIADAQAVPALVSALKDPSALVRGRAAQALGLVGAAPAASAIADAASGCPALIVGIAPDDEEPKTGEVEACRLEIVALVRLRQFDATARVVLDAQGEAVSQWWPVAFALQRSGDPRAAAPLVRLASVSGVYTQAFALRGLAALKDPRVVELAVAAASQPANDVRLRAEAVRSLGRSGLRDATPGLLKLLNDRRTPQNLILETITALGALADPRALDTMLDLFAAESPAVRAAAMTATARIDADAFLLAVSSYSRDPDFSVRANLATVLATLPADLVRDAVEALMSDPDVRVQGPALRALAKVGAPDVDQRIEAALKAPDFALRAAAAELVGERKPAGGAAWLDAAYTRAESDATDAARTAALTAIAKYPLAEARPTLERGLADREWPVRLVAASLLRQAGQASAAPVRPAPTRQDAAFFESDRVLRPPYTPYAYIETRRGTVQIELDIVNAPVTVLSFMELARAGFFNAMKVHRLIPNFVIQAGDPRGDGEGGPGYTMRDELSPLPYVRGTVGMALSGRDTGGSQFFITVSPQPHLEGQYTVFGKVISGWDTLDHVTLWDVIDRIRIWDGTEKRP